MNQNSNALRTPQEFPETSIGGYLPVVRQRKAAEETRLAASTALSAFTAALDRLEEVIDQETAALRAHVHADLDDFNRRKSRSLLDLTRLGRALTSGLDENLRARLKRLNEKLAENQAVLSVHLAAVKEIADLLVDALGQADSDGTYAMSGRRNAAR